MAGIKDVAKRAGVGVGTVSRMMNESGYVSAGTREKIKKAMEELEYTPNELARNLYHKKAGIVAVLVPSISNPFFAEFVEYVEAELYARGYKTMLCNAVRAGNTEWGYLDMLNRHIVDGVISGVHFLKEAEYQKLHKPIVALDRYLSKEIPVVAVDHKQGGLLAAKALIWSGCRKVLHFQGAEKIKSPYHDRHREFIRIMKKNKVELYNYNLEWKRFDMDYYRQVVDEVFSTGEEFDGVFGIDQLAINYINEAFRRGKKVPEDIKVVGYDGTYLSGLVRPVLTTIAQPIKELAKVSVDLIINMIDGRKYEDKKILLDVTLRKGGTTTFS